MEYKLADGRSVRIVVWSNADKHWARQSYWIARRAQRHPSTAEALTFNFEPSESSDPSLVSPDVAAASESSSSNGSSTLVLNSAC